MGTSPQDLKPLPFSEDVQQSLLESRAEQIRCTLGRDDIEAYSTRYGMKPIEIRNIIIGIAKEMAQKEFETKLYMKDEDKLQAALMGSVEAKLSQLQKEKYHGLQ